MLSLDVPRTMTYADENVKMCSKNNTHGDGRRVCFGNRPKLMVLERRWIASVSFLFSISLCAAGKQGTPYHAGLFWPERAMQSFQQQEYFCPECGAAIAPKAQVCPACQQALPEDWGVVPLPVPGSVFSPTRLEVTA